MAYQVPVNPTFINADQNNTALNIVQRDNQGNANVSGMNCASYVDAPQIYCGSPGNATTTGNVSGLSFNLLNADAASIIQTLPPAAANTGLLQFFYKAGTTSNTAMLKGSGSDIIYGPTPNTLGVNTWAVTTPAMNTKLYCSGAAWYVF